MGILVVIGTVLVAAVGIMLMAASEPYEKCDFRYVEVTKR